MIHRFLAGVSACALAIALTTGAAFAASTDCPSNFFGGKAPDLVGIPGVTTPDQLGRKARPLCFTEFAVLHSGMTRTPLYSAEHLTTARIAAAKHLRRADADESFHEESRLPADERSTLADFRGSGFDRGHLSNAGDASTPESKGETFTLANMMPQNPDNNRNLFEGMEESTRAMALQDGDVFVVTIPVFAGKDTKWLHDRVAIPAHIAKAIYIPSKNLAAVYLSDNVAGMAWKSISIQQLTTMTGIDPFPALPAAIKAAGGQLPEPMIHGSKGGH